MTARRPASGGRGSRLDPQGVRALFEMPVEAARDTIRSGEAKEGKEALYSTGPPQAGHRIQWLWRRWCSVGWND